MKKIWLKRAAWLIGILAAVTVGLHVGLHIISGRAWVHQKVAEKLSAATGREVRLGHAVLNLTGVKIEDFAVAKAGGFAEGNMFHVQQAQVKWSLWHLLHGQLNLRALEVTGLSLHVVRDEQGKLNTDFSAGTETAPEASSSGAPFDIAIAKLSARNLEITYTDQQSHLQAELQRVNVTVQNFAWDKPFTVQVQTSLHYQEQQAPFSAQLALAAEVNLAGLSLPDGAADISSFSLKAGDARAVLSGRVENFESPSFNLKLDGQALSAGAFVPFTSENFPFDIPRLSAAARGQIFPADQKAHLDKATVSLDGVDFSADGDILWARGESRLSADAQVQLDKLAGAFSSLKPYALAGNFTCKTTTTPKQVAVRAEWLNGGARLPRAGALSAVQAVLDMTEQLDLNNGQGTLSVMGELNDEAFKADFSFTQTPKDILANLKASAGRLVLPPAPPAEEQPAPQSAAPAQEPAPAATQSAWTLAPITARADVQIGSLDAPYLNGNDFDFQVDMSGITPKLDGAHGTLSLAINDGQITDLYQLTDSNAVMKVMFMSLNIVGKVFNSLDVLSVLGGLANSFKSDDEDEVIKMIPDEEGNLVPVKVPASSRKVDGKLNYDQFATQVQFEHGVATVKKGSFVSDMMSFNVSGTTDFKTEKINMTVHAAPGKHETDGVMPLTLKIGGTVSEPSGSMSVVGSVASLVTQSVTNNFASRAVKKSVGGVVGLFKKKDQPEESSAPEVSEETTVQEQPEETQLDEP